MTKKLKEFLQQQDIQGALASYNFKYIYNQLWEAITISPEHISEFSQLMLCIGYNPLDYMDYIPDFFLYGSKIKEFKIPNNITSIGYAAFYRCGSLTSVTFDNNSQLTSIGMYAFSGCRSLASIIMPSSVIKIGSSAFSGCRSLASIIIPSSVIKIGSSAFYECSNLKTVYYDGNQEDWDKIEIKSENEDLLNANIIFKK